MKLTGSKIIIRTVITKMRKYFSRYTKLFSRLSYMALGAALVVPHIWLCIVCLAVSIIFDAATYALSR